MFKRVFKQFWLHGPLSKLSLCERSMQEMFKHMFKHPFKHFYPYLDL